MSDSAQPPTATVDGPSMDDRETIVEVRDLKKYFTGSGFTTGKPVKAVDGVSFDIRRGETLGLVGESGCGKTTLGRTILRLERATEGAIRSNGTDVTALSGKQLREWQRDAQMVFQDPDSSLNDRMTIGEIIREPLDAHDWKTPAERNARVFDLIDKVGLGEEHFYRYPHQFSGGQRQRIGIARALALEPEFVVLDEPVSALDVSVQARIINLLEDLQDDLGLTYLFIAHDLSVVRHIADRVAVMYLGNIVELGPTEEVFSDPAHPYTISLLSAIPGSAGAGDVRGERITLRGTPPSPRDPPKGCPFSTRCPAKIRPDEYSLPGQAWEAVDELFSVFRARQLAERGILESLQHRLGLKETEDVDELLLDLFDGAELVAEDDGDGDSDGGGVGDGDGDDAGDGDAAGDDPVAHGDDSEQRVSLPVPETAAAVIHEAADRARTGDDEGAADLLREEFGSVCNTDYPAAYDVGEGRQSRCLRHEAEYRDPEPVIDERHR